MAPSPRVDERTLHLCVDMQRLFAEDTRWRVPWLGRILPNLVALASVWPERTIFTRFIPVDRPGEGRGAWKDYFERWPDMTRERLAAGLLDLAPALQALTPPARVLDKSVYSPWLSGELDTWLAGADISNLLVTGGETDVCVLATVLGAVDRGYRVFVVKDCLCSSSDSTHDALMTLYESRYSEQIAVISVAEAIEDWRRARRSRSGGP